MEHLLYTSPDQTHGYTGVLVGVDVALENASTALVSSISAVDPNRDTSTSSNALVSDPNPCRLISGDVPSHVLLATVF